RILAARGVRIVDGGDATPVRASCHSNLRERVCAAEIGREPSRRVVMTTRAHDAKAALARAPVVAIELRPIFTQRALMLDVADAGGQLLVLTPDAVSLVADAGGAGGNAGRVVASRPIRTSRVWPRDVRGLLRVTSTSFEAFLPGVTCRGSAAPFAMSCVDESEPWPIGLDNAGLTPSRNTFATPEGVNFYEAAVVARGGWFVVGEPGVLTVFDPPPP